MITVENTVTIIVGLLVTLGITQAIKNASGLYGFGATLLAVGISFVVALFAVLIQAALSGDYSPEKFAGYATTIFTTATIAYRAIQMATEK